MIVYIMNEELTIPYDNDFLLLHILKSGLKSERELAKELGVDNSTIHYKLRRMEAFNIIKNFKVIVDPYIISKDLVIEKDASKLDYSLISFRTEKEWINIVPGNFLGKDCIKRECNKAKDILFKNIKYKYNDFNKVKIISEINLEKTKYKLVISNSSLLSEEYLIWSFLNCNVYFIPSNIDTPKDSEVIKDYFINDHYFDLLLVKFAVNKYNLNMLLEKLLNKFNVKFIKTEYGLLLQDKNIMISTSLMSLFYMDYVKKALIDKSFNIMFINDEYRVYNLIEFLSLANTQSLN
ncbi:hypothetical protein [Acidianus manzaensis]|uniref:HTH asnC-type domain-containing protein n=1 Tax=Acidianus manzaensis TaxID=282676 RepID=A0A1W6JWJ6_9CREN|nr:hypothetical protein [Acidianus manzaensis]ARM74633.1 hypothetical protein B6F84_00400 [Acidianus manzaensis]